MPYGLNPSHINDSIINTDLSRTEILSQCQSHHTAKPHVRLKTNKRHPSLIPASTTFQQLSLSRIDHTHTFTSSDTAEDMQVLIEINPPLKLHTSMIKDIKLAKPVAQDLVHPDI